MKQLSDNEKFAILKLTRSASVGARSFRRLLEKYSTAENIVKSVKLENICDDDTIHREIESMQKFGAEFIFFEDDEYPPLLRQIPDAPPVLAFAGNRSKLKHFVERNIIAIVGARNSSIAANKLCRQIADDLGHNDIVIVSGMARGIDSESHRTSLNTGTIAVLASGIDVVYPSENRKLYEAVRAEGAIFAEMPFGTAPQSHLFPRRNRIIAGMASGTVVIEAARQSGSLITARFAAEYDRNVFVVPGFPLDLRSEGGNNLLKEGAILTLSARDILEHSVFSSPYAENAKYSYERKVVSEDLFKSEESSKDSGISEPEDISAHGKILNSLSNVPITIDELISCVKLSSREVMVALSELEAANKIVRLSGQKVCLASERRS